MEVKVTAHQEKNLHRNRSTIWSRKTLKHPSKLRNLQVMLMIYAKFNETHRENWFIHDSQLMYGYEKVIFEKPPSFSAHINSTMRFNIYMTVEVNC